MVFLSGALLNNGIAVELCDRVVPASVWCASGRMCLRNLCCITGTMWRQHFVSTADLSWIKNISDLFHSGQVGFIKNPAHEIDFFHTNAMLAGNAATQFQALFQDFFAGFQHQLDLTLVAFIKQQDRMHITITGVKNIDDS